VRVRIRVRARATESEREISDLPIKSFGEITD
jgi:hypothetical protein